MSSRYANLIGGPLIDEYRAMRREGIFDTMLQRMLEQFGPLGEGEHAGANRPSIELEKVGQLLGAAREVRRRSLRELATELGIDNTTIGRIERGQANPTIGTLQRLAAALGKQLRVSMVDANAEQAEAAPRTKVRRPKPPRQLDLRTDEERAAAEFWDSLLAALPKPEELPPLPTLEELFGGRS